jgi:glycerol-3-phosphate O-acyltransferase
MVLQRWHRFGYACVNFGTPISMRQYLKERGLDFRTLGKEERSAHLERLGETLMQGIGAIIPVLPVPLVATVFLQAGEPLSELEVKVRAFRLMTELQDAGAQVYIPRRDQDYLIEAGLRTLLQRRFVEEKDGLFAARPEERLVLAYYANSIEHLVEEGVNLGKALSY